MFLFGGPSQLETFDMKPEAPADIRGPFQPIHTNVPGIEITELLPKLSRLADKFTLIRSLHHERNEHSGDPSFCDRAAILSASGRCGYT